MGDSSQVIWKPVKGLETSYEVSNYGDVRNIRNSHRWVLKKKHNRFTGYDFYCLSHEGKQVTKTAHRLVAEAFIPNPLNLPYVNHIDEDKQNNTISNLEWCTAQFNSEWSKHKLYKRIALLSIDGEHLATFESERAAAELLGVTKPAICNALNGRIRTCAGFILRREQE